MIALRRVASQMWRRFLAWAHLDQNAVCDQSRGMSLDDYHDYGDDPSGHAFHLGLMRCERCGKYFMQ